eukprot:TRINITY_DN1657_c0_g1_i1.p1 TRINITY_DN1657_c0_g1~~TRINITY_DN1657_c0_g1_i1.p1  ORF type:complete len:662 (-),score=207.24 TRINITY_DN1657_c0_g1_i1:79-2064(-)
MPSLKKRSAARSRAPRETPKDIFPEDDVILSDVADEDVDHISFDPQNEEDDHYSNILKLDLPDQTDESSKKKSKKKKKKTDEEYWGFAKKNYYHDQDEDDEADDFDEDIDEAEEQEAKRLQAQKLNTLKAKDFYDDPAEAQFGDRLANDEMKEAKFEEIKENLQKERKQISEEEAATLPKDKKLELLKADAPELTALLKDVRENVANLRQKIAPLMERVKKGELKTSKGLSYLELKYHLMLSYCINISFYLLLKSEGKSVKDHPVIDTLVRLRTIIEKIRPLDKKLKFQIDKLLKSTPTTDAQITEDDDEDALKFKPNIKNMYSGSLHSQAVAEENAIDSSSGVYVPPRINSLQYDETEAIREKANTDREKQRAIRKKMANFIMQEYSEQPEQVAVDGYTRGEVTKASRTAKEKDDFEEENFVRLSRSKKEKASHKLNDSLAEFDDLESFDAIYAISGEKEKKDALSQANLNAAKKRSLAQIINEQEKLKKNKKTKFARGDDDLPVHDPFEIRESHTQSRGWGAQDEDEEEGHYQKIRRERQEQLEEKHRKEQEEDSRLDPLSRSVKYVKKTQGKGQYVPKPSATLEDGSKRKIDREIKKNRGLVPLRKKDAKNPRLKNRNKYEKALQKQKSAGVKSYQPPVTPYGGVAGIKTNISRSVKL